ncbi:acyloxyacyl hydrolase [Methylobacterium currus]|uniref:Acyloxyacyl hydrolase n=1 Tax=Methylobacterium currus TaxID=2051553 RepID=A0A2R4WV48_9HYPH|nr:acyloxyacyl hydrolase [Methylobacterium currus]AWB25414.1 acyloxyacyl hydrolase [Methylobacterium currus]UHC19793.1 acyloxyacyl hydrolase [Methylobacterium currus]
MRVTLPSLAVAIATATVLAAPAAQAADPSALVPAYRPPVQPLSIVSEFRIGGSAQDPGSNEKNTSNINGELLFAKPVTGLDSFWAKLIPRPTVGGSYNVDGRTSYAYLGATWTFDVTDRIFVEGFFGAGFHDGYTGPKLYVPKIYNSLGCSPLFREAAAIGFRIDEHWSVMATIEHMSNAGLCVENRGLTNYGGKIAYTF